MNIRPRRLRAVIRAAGRAYRLLRTIWRRFWVLPIDLYRKFISPALPDSCIYEPSCSAYTRHSIIRHGLLAGILLGILRIFRCLGILFTGGADPVPDRITLRALFSPWARFWKFRKKKAPGDGRGK